MISFHGVDIPYVLLANRQVTGTYEQLEMDAAGQLFTAGDKVVVAGGGTGWLMACIAEQVGPQNVRGIEPLKTLAELVESNVAVNGIPLTCVWGAITTDGQNCVVKPHDNWAETTVAEGVSGAQCPGYSLASLQGWGFDCFALDIEGGEFDVLTPAALSGVRKLLVEVHVHQRPDQAEGLTERLRTSGLTNKCSLHRDRDGAVIQMWAR
jgi:hypothetical protein